MITHPTRWTARLAARADVWSDPGYPRAVEGPSDWFWMRIEGAPPKGDPRDGELHRTRTLVESLYLEPWEGDVGGEDARYVGDSDEPEIDDEGRPVWRYAFCAEE